MFSHAAFSAASRKAAASASVPLADLDLAGSSRFCPIVVDEEAESWSCPILDLTVSSAPSVRDVLPPASAASPEQEVFRRELFHAARSLFEDSAATGTVRTYEATLRGTAPKVTLKLGSQVLPMSAEAQFYAFFGSNLFLGPESSPPAK